jgi:hypothetical protein
LRTHSLENTFYRENILKGEHSIENTFYREYIENTFYREHLQRTLDIPRARLGNVLHGMYQRQKDLELDLSRSKRDRLTLAYLHGIRLIWVFLQNARPLLWTADVGFVGQQSKKMHGS